MNKNRILNMVNSEIIKMLSDQETFIINDLFVNENNFCNIYRDSATLSNKDIYFNPSEFLDIYLNNEKYRKKRYYF